MILRIGTAMECNRGDLSREPREMTGKQSALGGNGGSKLLNPLLPIHLLAVFRMFGGIKCPAGSLSGRR